MHFDLEVRLIHDGREWVAGGAGVEARGRTLDELDQDIKKALQASGRFPQGKKMTILMKFDEATMPDYDRVRQYRPEYFHRVVEVEV